LGRNSISRNPKIFNMEVDGVWNMASELVEERRSHIDDTNRGVIYKARQLSCLNESGVVRIFERGCFGWKRGWKKKE
jgi:hypothetical protein